MEDKRVNKRSQNLNGKFPGKLFLPDKQIYINARPIDVSSKGMSILSDMDFVRGGQIWMLLEGAYIKFEVTYCRPAESQKNLMRCGLSCIDRSLNVAEIFAKYGCLKSNYDSSS